MTPAYGTPESFITSFPAQLPKLEGEPSYESLALARSILQGNAASIPSNRGGGANGYLGIVITDAQYLTISEDAFEVPDYPGAQPHIPYDTSAADTKIIVRAWEEDTREWREYTNVHLALKKQLIESMDPIYLRSLRDRLVGFGKKTVREMLTFLFSHYGHITPLDLKDNFDRLWTAWDPSTPFEILVDQIEEGAQYAEDGKQPLTNELVVNTAYTLVFNTGLFFEDCKQWSAIDEEDRTWSEFKDHFFSAHRELKLQQKTSQQAGFHGANALTTNSVDQIREETADALANFADRACTDQQTMIRLQEALLAMEKRLQEKEDAVSTQMADFTRQLNAQRTNRAPNNNRDYGSGQNNNSYNGPNRNNANGGNGQQRENSGKYCWTHGFRVQGNHTSQTCNNRNPGHQTQATKNNKMGGSNTGQNRE